MSKRPIVALLLLACLGLCLYPCARAEGMDQAPAPAIWLWTEDVPYMDESPDQDPPFLTAYAAKGAEIALIICPGGGYHIKSRLEGARIAMHFRERGFSCFVLDYRVDPGNPLAPLADANRAVRVVRAMGYRYVGIMGFSAGGHLAACAAVHWDRGNSRASDTIERVSCRPDFLVCCYAVTSFVTFPQQGSAQRLLGEAYPDPALLVYFSPERYVNAETPPAFIWHSALDAKVSPRHSMLLAEAFSKAGVPYELHIYPDGKHGINLAKKYPFASQWPDECARFIDAVCAPDGLAAQDAADIEDAEDAGN